MDGWVERASGWPLPLVPSAGRCCHSLPDPSPTTPTRAGRAAAGARHLAAAGGGSGVQAGLRRRHRVGRRRGAGTLRCDAVACSPSAQRRQQPASPCSPGACLRCPACPALWPAWCPLAAAVCLPAAAAHLEGALQITIDGAYHSPLGAEDGRPLDSVELSSGAAAGKGQARGTPEGCQTSHGCSASIWVWLALRPLPALPPCRRRRSGGGGGGGVWRRRQAAAAVVRQPQPPRRVGGNPRAGSGGSAAVTCRLLLLAFDLLPIERKGTFL